MNIMSFSLVFSFLSRCFFCLVSVIKVTSFGFCAIRQHNKAVPVLLGLAGSSGWVHQAVWCHQAGVTAGASPLAMGAGASREPGILKLESHRIVW